MPSLMEGVSSGGVWPAAGVTWACPGRAAPRRTAAAKAAFGSHFVRMKRVASFKLPPRWCAVVLAISTLGTACDDGVTAVLRVARVPRRSAHREAMGHGFRGPARGGVGAGRGRGETW